jgi:hypothetical protein
MGTTTLSGNIDLVNANLSGTLDVAGNTKLGNAAVSGTLGVTGATQLTNTSVSGTLGVAGNTQLTNAALSGTLGVVGNTQLTNAALSGTLGVVGNTQLTNAALSGTLGVTGTATIHGSIVSLSNTENEFSSIQIFNPLNTTSPKGRITATPGDFYLQGPQYNGGSIIISKYDDGQEIALFDTSTGTNAGSTQLQLIRSVMPDNTKANNTYYKYNLGIQTNISSLGLLTNWIGTSDTTSVQIQTVGSDTNAGWVCPKSGMYLVKGLIHYFSNAGAQLVLQKYPDTDVPADTYNMAYELVGLDTYNATLQRYIPIFAGDVCAVQVTVAALTQYTDTSYLQFQLIQEFI